MQYVSELIGRPVADLDGEKMGTLKDLLAVQGEVMTHPHVVAIEVGKGGSSVFIPVADVVVLIAPAIALNRRQGDISPYEPSSGDLYLVRDVLDKQIIDMNGVRVVRVNDLELTRVNGDFYVSNVDTTNVALVRRLGLTGLTRRLANRTGKKTGGPSGIISWDNVELLGGDQPMRLKVSAEKIAELHPADLAEILSDLNRTESSKFLEAMDVETLADTLEEVEPDFQASLIERMDNERVADVLEEMSPDEAADLLAELPQDRSQELLGLMESDEAEDVRRLLAYPVDSAGGLMNTEFMSVPPTYTAEQVMEALRDPDNEAETIYYIYVTQNEHLEGVFSLRQLVRMQPDVQVSTFMEKRVVTVNLEDSQDDCAQVVSKYNLLAVPVVDDEKRLYGIVTADDALDKIIPTAWKKRLPSLYR